MNRYLYKTIEEFAKKKFVLLAGPRQVGKTSIGKKWLSLKESGVYLNWDDAEDRVKILKKNYLPPEQFITVLLDEIHKYPRWKNYLKGLYDKEAHRVSALVTGSARLDLYKKGGDSLLGRYELLRLHPLSIGELTHGTIPPPPEDWLLETTEEADGANWERLLTYGGFPEPYSEQDPLQHQRWSSRRRELLIREDLRDLTEIKLIELVEHLYLLLPDRIGSPLSLNGLKEEIGVAHNSIASWLTTLELLYICYRISPYHKKIARSLKKEQKLYLWDWSQITNPAARFENIVASHLLKSVHAWTDLGYGAYNLMYWRNKEKEEVDFVVLKNNKPLVLFESKLSDDTLAQPLYQLSAQLGDIPAIQLVAREGVKQRVRGCLIVTAKDYLARLV